MSDNSATSNAPDMVQLTLDVEQAQNLLSLLDQHGRLCTQSIRRLRAKGDIVRSASVRTHLDQTVDLIIVISRALGFDPAAEQSNEDEKAPE